MTWWSLILKDLSILEFKDKSVNNLSVIAADRKLWRRTIVEHTMFKKDGTNDDDDGLIFIKGLLTVLYATPEVSMTVYIGCLYLSNR